jgi:hypothetical protein
MQIPFDNEIWRAVNLFPNYQVSTHGRVRSVKTGRILKPCADGGGYLKVILMHDHHRGTKKIHKLVGEAFLDNPGDKPCVDHKNGNKTENDVSNLRWATHIENGRNKTKQANTSSQYKGVCWDKKANKWRASIFFNGKKLHLGSFNSEIEASRKYIEKAQAHFGEFANY